MFITQVKRRAVLLQSFKHFMASFLWSIRVQTMENCGSFVFTITFIFSTKRRCSCCFSYFCSTFAASSTNSLSEISPHMLTFGSSLSMLRSKIIFTKNQKRNNRYCGTCYVISMVYTLIDHSSRPISARGFAQLSVK